MSRTYASTFLKFELTTVAKVLALLAVAFSLSGCQEGQLDSMCLWGPQPNEERVIELKSRGVKTIINVRLNKMQQLEETTKAHGMNYVHIPTGVFKPPEKRHIQQFLDVVKDPSKRPVYVCDQVAHDRTQFYVGVYGMAQHKWSAERASEEMYKNGLRRWWPWFYKYKGVVAENEAGIHNGNVLPNSEEQSSFDLNAAKDFASIAEIEQSR